MQVPDMDDVGGDRYLLLLISLLPCYMKWGVALHLTLPLCDSK